MQERVERWLRYWVAKPASWAIYGIWLALLYTWRGCVWCVNRLRERWAAWRAKRKAAGNLVLHPVTAEPTNRASKQQAA